MADLGTLSAAAITQSAGKLPWAAFDFLAFANAYDGDRLGSWQVVPVGTGAPVAPTNLYLLPSGRLAAGQAAPFGARLVALVIPTSFLLENGTDRFVTETGDPFVSETS